MLVLGDWKVEKESGDSLAVCGVPGAWLTMTEWSIRALPKRERPYVGDVNVRDAAAGTRPLSGSRRFR
jgi:hypothetical protein